MKKNIPFVKYTCYGNNFVIVDETVKQILSEEEKSRFSYQATNTFFGIGCDNLLVVQRCTDGVLSEINEARNYWDTTPDSSKADFIFRMFEPNGDEAFSCGNGLMSIANYLYQRYGTESAKIMTEVPFATPRVITIGTDPKEGLSWVNLGRARRVPADVASHAVRRPVDDCIDAFDKITIKFRSYDLKAYTDKPSLQMSGYLVFTGEPHLVIFPDDTFSDLNLAKCMFSLASSELAPSRMGGRVSVGLWLAQRIGEFLNDSFRSHFPSGINVNFAKVYSERQCVEYRCFERGINRETLTCGTGAAAVAVVSKHLGYLRGRVITVLPHLCRGHDLEAAIQVIQAPGSEWCLFGTPSMLVDGNFVSMPGNQGVQVVHCGYDTFDVLTLEEQLLRRRTTGTNG